MTRIVLILCAVLTTFALGYCKDNKDKDRQASVAAEKEKMLWMDAEASFMSNFSTPEKITALLDKVKEAGFNKIVVDLRPVEGDVLYQSAFMTPYKDAATRGYDYMQFMLDEAGKRDIKVTVSTTIFTAGYLPGDSHGEEGPVWRDAELRKLVCMQYTPDGKISSLLEAAGKTGAGSFAFLNPVHPDAQVYALRFIEEIVSKYDFDAYALDYCRFPDAQSDFSDFTRDRFKEFLGVETIDWPGDVFTYNPDGSHNPGKYYKDWWQFRATVIHDFIEIVKHRITTLKPGIKLEYWAGSWLSMNSGQNWASSTYNLLDDPDAGLAGYADWQNAGFSKAGFADLLDTFLLGTYIDNTYMGAGSPDGKYQDPQTEIESMPMESMEYSIIRAKRYINNACAMYGNVIGTNPADVIEEQMYYCLTQSDGVMVFDVSHFAHDEAKWAAFKHGIERADKELKEQAASGQ